MTQYGRHLSANLGKWPLGFEGVRRSIFNDNLLNHCFQTIHNSTYVLLDFAIISKLKCRLYRNRKTSIFMIVGVSEMFNPNSQAPQPSFLSRLAPSALNMFRCFLRCSDTHRKPTSEHIRLKLTNKWQLHFWPCSLIRARQYVCSLISRFWAMFNERASR